MYFNKKKSISEQQKQTKFSQGDSFMDLLAVTTNKYSSDLRSSVLMSHTQVLEPKLSRRSEIEDFNIERPKSNKYSGIQNGLEVFKLNKKFIKAEACLSILIGLSLLLQICYFEIQIDRLLDQSLIILWALFINCFGSLAASWSRFKIRDSLAKLRRQEKTKTIEIGVELFSLLIQPHFFLEHLEMARSSVQGEQLPPMKINHFLIMLSIPKIILFSRGILQLFTEYSNPRSNRVCKFYGEDSNYLFHLRCLFKDHPVILIAIMEISCLFILAYSYRICEINVNTVIKMDYFDNCLWLALMGMTSVGYGDMYPTTQIGTMINLVAGFIGVIGTSLFVLSILLNLQLNYHQERSLLILKRIEMKKLIKDKSSEYLNICLSRLWQEKKKNNKIAVSSEQRSLRHQLFSLRKQCKGMVQESARFQQVMLQQFEYIHHNLVELYDNEKKIVDEIADKQAVMTGVASHMISKSETSMFNQRKFEGLVKRIQYFDDEVQMEPEKDHQIFAKTSQNFYERRP